MQSLNMLESATWVSYMLEICDIINMRCNQVSQDHVKDQVQQNELE